MNSHVTGRGRRPIASASFVAALVLLSVLLPLVPEGASPAQAGVPQPGGIDSVDLTLLGQTNLASPGIDGTTKPRGNNGDVAVLNGFAYVAGGALFHGAQSSPGRICTDYGGVKVVDISNPANPQLEQPIDIVDLKGVGSVILRGNNREFRTVTNVSTSVSSVDAMSVNTASFQGDLLAIATQRCEQFFTTGARIEFWDVTTPSNPTMIGDYNPEEIPRPSGPPNHSWGIFEDVRMFTRPDQPGKLFALATSPFSAANGSPIGDFRLLDITNPMATSADMQIGTFPSKDIGQNSENGCRTFAGGRSAAPSPDRTHAIFSFYDGSYFFDNDETAAVFKLTLDNLPQYVASTNPPQFNPDPPHWGYPRAALDQGWLDEGSKTEGNAADVQPFTGPGGKLMTFVSEEDFDPAITMFSIDNPTSIAGTSRACEGLFNSKIYRLPGQQLSDDAVYVGRGCPASLLDNTTNTAPDSYIDDPFGKIAVVATPQSSLDGCSTTEIVKRAQAAGATGVIFSLTSDFLNLPIPGPEGGYPNIPVVSTQRTAHTKMVGHQAHRFSTGATFPDGAGSPSNPADDFWVRSTSSNVTLAQNALEVGIASGTPIQVAASQHGLTSGDRVRISGVEGNTAANGNWTITVVNNSQFTLNGSASNDFHTGGGIVQLCPPSNPNCSSTPTRTDFSRFKSVANSTDRTARGQWNPAFRFDVVGGQTFRAGAFMEVASHTDGAFRTAIEWYDAGGGELGDSQIMSLNAVTSRTRFTQDVTAPAGAVKASAKFEWTGATAQGVAYADTITLIPKGLHVTLEDQEDEWGGQRIIDFSQDPIEVGSYRSPTSLQWPPPDQGIYGPRLARTINDELAFTTWMSDGLRVLDISHPTDPREVGAFVPPDVADPSSEAGAGPTNRGESGNMLRGDSWPDKALVTGVDVFSTAEDVGIVLISDINYGLYILGYEVNRVQPEPTCPGFANDSRNQVVGTAANETLVGTAGADIMCGLGGVDLVMGNGGADLILGAGGNDDLRGGPGNDALRGNGGNDRMDGAAGADNLLGHAGRDNLLGKGGNDLLNGGTGSDACDGGTGRNTLRSCER